MHLINAFIFIIVLSAANSSIYIGSRTILFMAQEDMAPRFLGKTNSRGVPAYAIIFTNLFGVLSIMNVSTGGGKAYSPIVNLSDVSNSWSGEQSHSPTYASEKHGPRKVEALINYLSNHSHIRGMLILAFSPTYSLRSFKAGRL